MRSRDHGSRFVRDSYVSFWMQDLDDDGRIVHG